MKKLMVLFAIASSYTLQAQKLLLFTGTYTDGKPGKGIYIFQMDTATGALTPTATGQDITNPSFLTISPNGQWLFACTDTKTPAPGNVTAFDIDSVNGAIRFRNKQTSVGANPVYVTAHKDGRWLVVPNYTGGSVTVLPIHADGSIGEPAQSIRFSGHGPDTARQDQSHVHSAFFSPDYHYVFLPDLGTDQIRAFRFDPRSNTPLTADSSRTQSLPPGSGPRHLAFHPNRRFMYCIEEMGGQVDVFALQDGHLKKLQRIMANRQPATSYASADIHLSPDGRFLYTSNRIENTIAMFSVATDGRLKRLGHIACGGDVPRNFTIDPTGKFLLVANQGGNNIVVFRRNVKTGLLNPTGQMVSVPAPSCLQMRWYN